MEWEEIAQLPREKLLALLWDAYRNLIRIDGYWFLAVEQAAGQEKAVIADEEVWRRFGRVEAQQLKRAFNLEGDGVGAVMAALQRSPLWPFWARFRVEQTSPQEALLQVTHCSSQVERVKAGLGVFPCRGVDEAYFQSFAQALNPRIKVHCLSAPPEQYSENLWCSWRFVLEDGLG